MKKKNQKIEFDWEDSIDKDVSPEDQLKHKKHAQNVVKAKKVRKILFWTFSAAALSSIVIATVAINLSKPSKALIYWYNHVKKYSFNSNNLNNNDIRITVKKGTKIEGTPEDVMSKIISNTSEENFKLLFKDYALAENLKPEKNWNIEYENFVIDSISKNTLFIDLVFKQKGNTPIDFVIKNFPIVTSENTKKYNDEAIEEKKNQFTNEFIESIKKQILYKLLLPINIKDNFSDEKINKYKNAFKSYIEKINEKISNNIDNFPSLLDISWSFSEPFKVNDNLEEMKIISNFVTETNNFYSPIIFTSPITLKGFDQEDWKNSSKLVFKGRIITLSTNTEKINKVKTQYGIYIEPKYENQEIQFEIPLLFDKNK
ncbi:hypothetical protein [Mycoplasmopsis arginini]|uniref:hypothetical protein n=1 Tax=Mycoplasmopsis arginini TaxID=2094 RepID=UPI0005C26CFA|nr:hypothetical protein [Mycoplasmopsis arginini]BAQ54636.1 hypothetical protein MARG145_0718 [Mycoplasmopsis arginini]